MIARFFPDPATAERVRTDLKAAGLPAALPATGTHSAATVPPARASTAAD